MTYYYSDPAREREKFALPNVEVFYAERGEWATDDNGERCDPAYHEDGTMCDENPTPNEAGFYYWYCFPGCMPDSDPWGPYETEDAAVQAMRAEGTDW